MEHECADSSEKKGDRYIQTSKKGHKNCGSKHGKQVLHAKNKHARRAQFAGIINSILWFHVAKLMISHVISEPLRYYLRNISRFFLSHHHVEHHHQDKSDGETDSAEVGMLTTGGFWDEFLYHHIEHGASGKSQHVG